MPRSGFVAPTALSIMLFAALATPAQAAVSTYGSRSSFLAAAGGVQVQTFNSFTADQAFHTAALTVGDAIFQGFGVNPTGFNFIDAAPVLGPVPIDGTSYLLGGVAVGGGFTITYSHPITAWGADFNDLQNQVARMTIEAVGAGTVSPPVAADNRTLSFFGLSSNTPFTVLRFTGINASVADGFGMDNLTTPVPEPSTTGLLALGGLVLLAWRRRRGQAGAGLLAALIGAAAPAQAATEFFDSEASFAAASQGLVAYGFEGIVPAGASVFKAAAVTVGPLGFTSNGNKFVTDRTGGFGDYGASKLDAQIASPAHLTLLAGVAGGATALSFQVGSYIGVFGVDVVVNGSDHHAIVTPAQAGRATTFVGMTSTVPITSVSFTTTVNPVNHTSGHYAGLDLTGFQVGQAAAVPEAGTPALMVAGLALLAALGACRRGA